MNRNFKPDLKASKICEGQIYLESNFKPDLRASKICEGQIYLGPDFEPDLRASVLCGRKMSLEPDFKPESFLMIRNFFIEPGFCNCHILTKPEIF